MKVAVTGATGFIGKHVVRHLRNEGVTVYGFSLNGGYICDIKIDAVDLFDESQVLHWQLGKRFNVIVHLAAHIPDQVIGADAERSLIINTVGMMNVLKLAKISKSHLIYASGTSVYGMSPRSNIPLAETCFPKPDNYYTTSKYIGELMCEQQVNLESLSYTALRISAPYGPGNSRRTVINIFLELANESKDLVLHGSGSRIQDFTYINDVIESIFLSMQNRPQGVYNIASGSPISMRALAERVIQVVPGTASKIAFNGKPDLQESYRGIFSIEKAHNVFGWSPKVSLEQGLRSTLSWLIEKTKAC